MSTLCCNKKNRSHSNDREVFADALENFEGALEVSAFVRGGDDGAQPRLAFRHDRIADGQGEDAFVKKLARKVEGLGRFADDDGRDGRFALAGVEAELLQAALEKFRVAPQALDELCAGFGIEKLEGGLASGGDGGRMGSRKKEWSAAMIEKIDEIAGAADVSADGADGFAERADLDVNAAVTAEMIHGAASVASENAGGMRVVHHHDAIVFFSEVAKLREGGDVAFHGKNAVGDEQLVAVPVFGFFENALAIGDILVLENFYGGFGEAAAVNDGGVVEFVGDDQVFLAENGGDGPGVGGEAGLENDAGFRALEAGDLLFELHVNFHGADDGADGAGADSVFADGVNGCAAEFGMGGQAEVIVGAEIDDLFAVHGGDGLLLAFEDAQAIVEVLLFEVFHRVAQIFGLRTRGGDGRRCSHDSVLYPVFAASRPQQQVAL